MADAKHMYKLCNKHQQQSAAKASGLAPVPLTKETYRKGMRCVFAPRATIPGGIGRSGSTAYPTKCVRGEPVVVIGRNSGTPPVHCRWSSGATYWVHYEDLRLPHPSELAKLELTRAQAAESAPERVEVVGAGCPEFNGIYARDPARPGGGGVPPKWRQVADGHAGTADTSCTMNRNSDGPCGCPRCHRCHGSRRPHAPIALRAVFAWSVGRSIWCLKSIVHQSISPVRPCGRFCQAACLLLHSDTQASGTCARTTAAPGTR